jgi:hypothetical protein
LELLLKESGPDPSIFHQYLLCQFSQLSPHLPKNGELNNKSKTRGERREEGGFLWFVCIIDFILIWEDETTGG